MHAASILDEESSHLVEDALRPGPACRGIVEIDRALFHHVSSFSVEWPSPEEHMECGHVPACETCRRALVAHPSDNHETVP